MANVNWAKSLSVLLAGGSLGYLFADRASVALSLPAAAVGAVAWLLQRRRTPDRPARPDMDELARSERRYHALVQTSSSLVWHAGGKGEFDTPQPEWTAFTGQDFAAMAGLGWLSAVHPQDRDRVSADWAAAVAKRAQYHAGYRLRRADGEYREMDVRAVPLRDDGGRFLEWVGVHVDVSEQERERQMLAASERHIHRVLDRLFAFVSVLDTAGTLISVNEAPLKIAGIRAEDVVGKPFWECYWWSWSPLIQEELKASIGRARNGETLRYDVDIRVAGGSLMTIDFMIAPMRDDDQQITHLIPSGVDVSDRKQAEAALSERERFYRQLIEAMPLLTWTCLPDGTCDYVCARWGNFAGQGADPGSVFTTMEGVNPEDRQSFRSAWQDGIQSGQSFQTEVRLRRDDGIYRWFALYAAPMKSARGELIKWCGTSIDINDRKQMEQALRESETRLRNVNNTLERRVKERTAELVERSDQLRALALDLSETESRERRRLAQVLHDDFQQLVSAAKLKAGILRRKTVDEPSIQSLRQVESLLEEAITASRMVATQLSPPVLHDAGLAPALQWLVRRMEVDHELHVDLQVEGGCDPDNEQVRVIIFECIREILFNVRKHAGVDHARLTLRLLPEGLLRVEVVDEGSGFEAIKLERRKATDMSFGLFSIRERMSLIGGLLTVESQPGKGTRVALSVPCVSRRDRGQPAVAQAPQRMLAPIAISGSRRLRVLVADDHALFREGLVALLSQEPYLEVIGQAGDGEEAIRMARELRPDLAIVDVSMPKANGVQVTASITRELPETRVVGLSMHEEEDMAKSMRDAGAVGYFGKSDAPEETLLAMLRGAVSRVPE